jgi:hypothetical protein
LIFPDFNNEMRFERMPPDLRNTVISMRLILCCPNTSGAVTSAAARQLIAAHRSGRTSLRPVPVVHMP